MAYATEVKYFDSKMVGAPVMSGLYGSLLAVLDACLVTGFNLKTVDSIVVVDGVATATVSTGHGIAQYAVILIAGATPVELNGEKRVTWINANTLKFDATGISNQTATGSITLKMAPAGWEKPFSGTNKAVFRSPNVESTRMYFRFDDTGNYNCKVRGYETMSDIDTGTGPFPTVGQMANGTYFFRSGVANPSTAAKDWFIIANDRFVFIGNRGYSTGTNYPFQTAGFGDFASRKSPDAFRALLRGNILSDSAQQPGASESITSTGNTMLYSYLARDFTGLGGAASMGLRAYFSVTDSIASGANTVMAYPNPVDYSLVLCRMFVSEPATSALRGDLPGMYYAPQNMVNRFCPDAATPLFLTGIPDVPDRIMVAVPTAHSGTSYGITFFDITGPWGN